MDKLKIKIKSFYEILEKIGENSVSDVYKIQGKHSPMIFVLKILKNKKSFYRIEEILRFKQGLKEIYNIKHPNITEIFEIDNFDNNLYCIMEYINGKTLNEYLTSGRKLNYNDILNIIKGIGEGLKQAHRHGIIHKNLNINNIILEYTEKKFSRVKITNFGFAEVIFPYREFDKEFSNNNIKNILCFLAPETFTMCNQKIDHRTDLFSLGIIFYYLLTGKLPFEAMDMDNYYRNIITDIPEKPSAISKYKIPEIVDDIILKLLEKNKKHRYQSTEGLLVDLERLIRGEDNFDLGIEDVTFTTNFESDLIGREKELNKLKKEFDKTLRRKSSIVLLESPKGYGKSKLLEDFSKYGMINNCIYLKSNCSSIKNKIPYKIINDLFERFTDYYCILDNSKKEEIKKRLLNMYKTSLSILLSNFNSLKSIINNIELKPVKRIESKDLFYKIVTDFIISISDVSTPLVIIINDIGWADNDSLELLNKLCNSVKNNPINIILTLTTGNTKKIKLLNMENIKKMKLQSLNKTAIKNIIFNIMIKKHSNIPEKIINFIFDNSKGNPLFAIEILRQLIYSGVIFPVIDTWETDKDKMEKFSSKFKPNIILNKINILKNTELTLLKYTSLYELDFDIDTIIELCEINKNEIIKKVDYMIDQNLFKLIVTKKGNRYITKEIIKEKLLKKIGKNEKKEIHEKIGFYLEKKMNKTLDRRVYLTAHQFLESGNISKSIEYLLKAGEYAISENAFNESLNYFKKLKSILKKNGKENTDQWKQTAERISKVSKLIKK